MRTFHSKCLISPKKKKKSQANLCDTLKRYFLRLPDSSSSWAAEDIMKLFSQTENTIPLRKPILWNNWEASYSPFLTLEWEMVRLSTGWPVSNSWISSITWASEPRITTLCSQPSAVEHNRGKKIQLSSLLVKLKVHLSVIDFLCPLHAWKTCQIASHTLWQQTSSVQ